MDGERALLKGSIEAILRLPPIPSSLIVSELWQTMGGMVLLRSSWPSWDAELVKEEKVMIAVQVNGKLRDTCEADRGMGEDALKEMVFGFGKSAEASRGQGRQEDHSGAQ